MGNCRHSWHACLHDGAASPASTPRTKAGLQLRGLLLQLSNLGQQLLAHGRLLHQRGTLRLGGSLRFGQARLRGCKRLSVLLLHVHARIANPYVGSTRPQATGSALPIG